MKYFLKVCLACLSFLDAASAAASVEMGPAATLMASCEAVIYEEKESLGLVDASLDPDRTGLIGVEFSPLTTSLGHWPDKRAAALPVMADVVATYLADAGVKEGDWVAVNASASFPGFVLATLCALETLKLNGQVVFSYGASMYGGTQPEYTFPVMLDRLNAKGLLHTRLRAVAPGGAWDRMGEVLLEDPIPTVRALLDSRSEERLEEPVFANAIKRRLAVFSSAPRPIRCFVSCGAPWTSMGLDEEDILKVGYGLLKKPDRIPQGPERGLIFEYLERDVPVIHLLFARGICREFGLPYSDAEPGR